MENMGTALNRVIVYAEPKLIDPARRLKYGKSDNTRSS